MSLDEAYPAPDAFVRDRLGLDLEGYSGPIRRSVVEIVRNSAGDTDHAIRELEERCSIPETYFYRHAEQWNALGRVIADRTFSAPDVPLRAWCAGVATGEEAFTLAHLARKTTGVDPAILGTDMSAMAIRRAQRATYSAWSFRDLPPERISELVVATGDSYAVLPELRACVQFERRNLVQEPYFPTGLDLILCRNVFLYFDREAARVVLCKFADSLADGGVLMLGPFDPMVDLASAMFDAVPGMFGLFRKTDVSTVRQLSGITTRRRLSTIPSRPPTVPPAPSGPSSDELLLDALDSGGTEELVRRYLELRERDPISVEMHVAASFALSELGRDNESLASARAAYMIDPSSTLAEASYGLCLARVGERARAIPILRDARISLASSALSTMSGTDALDLIVAVDSALAECHAT